MLDIFLRKNIESGIKKQKNRKREFLGFNNMQSVLILFDYNDWHEIENIVDDLMKSGKEVILWTILHKSDNQETTNNLPQQVRVVDLHKDVNWKKMLRPEIIDEYLALNYNTLLDCSVSDENYMALLRAHSSASFNIGFRELENKLYDFVILKEENMTLLEAYEQMKIYQEHLK